MKNNDFVTIKDAEYGGERPLFASHGLRLENVHILPGESALKCCYDIQAHRCSFNGKYPFWHTRDFTIDDCDFLEGARAAIWYSSGCVMRGCRVLAPKMFREVSALEVSDTDFPDAEETLWHCSGVRLRNVSVKRADYLFMHSTDIDIANYHQEGNYSFQYCKRVVIRDAEIYSKDAFWNTEDVTVRDSLISGEYLGWHSRNLHLINCRIAGTQPLCYCEGLRLDNCTFDNDADLAFEDSALHAVVNGHIVSVKNPRSGEITARSIGELIIDKNVLPPADCKIITQDC